MSAVTAEQVKELREKTGAGMMECKKALAECGGDQDAAVKWLREKGIAGAEKKAGRAASEGLAGLKVAGAGAVIVELNCETDFVAKTEQFQALLASAVEAAAAQPSLPADPAAAALSLAEAKSADGQPLGDKVKSAISALGENMGLSRVLTLKVKQGLIGSYRHFDGKLCALVAVECGKAESARHPDVAELAKDLALQLAGNLPPAEFVSREQISPEVVAREREIAMVQAKEAGAGKPAAIVEKIAEGKVNKVLQEISLMDQVFLKDSNLKIAGLLKQVGEKVGDSLSVSGFARLKVGIK